MTISPVVAPSDLTLRERQVAELVARGMITKQIADLLGVSRQRVRVLIAAIAYKTGARPDIDDRVHVALWWHRAHSRPRRRSA